MAWLVNMGGKRYHYDPHYITQREIAAWWREMAIVVVNCKMSSPSCGVGVYLNS